MLNGSNGAGGASLVNSATGAAGALAGWAIASLGKQLPVSEVHTAISATPAQVQQPLSVQRNSSDIFQSNAQLGGRASASSSRSVTPSQATRLPPARKAGGMQLGGSASHVRAAGNAAGSTSLVDTLAGEFEEDGDEVANAWGSNDLMDVNADADDWSKYITLRCAHSTDLSFHRRIRRGSGTIGFGNQSPCPRATQIPVIEPSKSRRNARYVHSRSEGSKTHSRIC